MQLRRDPPVGSLADKPEFDAFLLCQALGDDTMGIFQVFAQFLVIEAREPVVLNPREAP